jgi:V/A-type H+-transporting ATPase subunit I
MSQAKILFLKSEAELVMDVLNKHGNFHLTLKEADTSISPGQSEQVRDLIGRLGEVISKSSALIIGETYPVKGDEQFVLEAEDWPSFISIIDKEISSYEKEILNIEAGIQKDAKARPIFELWKKYATAPSGLASLDLLQSFERITSLILYAKKEVTPDLAPALPDSCLNYIITSRPMIYLVLCLKRDRTKVLQTASERGYSLLESLEGMPADYSSIGLFLETFEASQQKFDESLATSKKSIALLMPRLNYLSSLLSDAYSVLNIKERASVEDRWEVLEGYVPSKLGDLLISDLNKTLNGRMISFIQEEHSSNNVPVKYQYPKFFNYFYTVTNLFGVPNYNEVNPTPILAFTFPVLFGFMFGDIGHGLMLAAIGLLFYRYTKSLSRIGVYLIICGVFGAIMGATLYGEAFGKHIYSGLLTPTGIVAVLNGQISVSFVDLMNVFRFALFVGVFQISLGIVIGAINNLLQHKKEDAFLVNLPKLALFLASVYVAVVYGINFINWMSGPIYFILVPLLFFWLAKPFYSIIAHDIHEGLSSLGMMSFELFDTIIRFVSNTVSYLRIFAMVIAHVMLTAIFYVLGDLFGGGMVGILLAVVGNIFVVLLEGIIALAQDLRLHFYEWFSRFYEDDGVMFSPFKLRTNVPILRK